MASSSAAVASKGLLKRSAGVRRLLQEAQELERDACPDYAAAPLEDDLFTWHFTIRGGDGDFEGGLYHGKMVLPSEYPFKPPEIYMLTPSGRFEVNKKICLSISSFHPETWQPSWGIRTALLALMAFFPTEPKGAVGSLDAPPAERRRLALASQKHQCAACGFDAADAASFAALPPPAAAEPSAGEGAGGQGEGAEEVNVELQAASSEAGQPVSDSPSGTRSPAPPDSDDGEGECEADEPLAPLSASAVATTAATIFPSAAAPSPHTSQPPPSASARHRAPAPSPSRLGGDARPHAHTHGHPHPGALAAPNAPRLSPAHLPPSPSALSAPAPPPAPAPASVEAAVEVAPGPAGREGGAVPALPPALTLAQVSAGATGGPPMWVDRAILVVLMALVAAVVRKVA